MSRKNLTASSERMLVMDFGLYPLGELVDRYEQVSEAARALFEGSYHVEAPNHGWACDGDGLELLCW